MPTRSNEQLCRLAQKGDTAARDILLEKNLGFIRKIALEQYLQKSPPQPHLHAI